MKQITKISLKKTSAISKIPALANQTRKNSDLWQSVKGILPKKPTGLGHQGKMRAEWL